MRDPQSLGAPRPILRSKFLEKESKASNVDIVISLYPYETGTTHDLTKGCPVA